MIYVFISYDCYPLPLAKHLIDEGEDVIKGVVRVRSEMKVPGIKDDEKPEERKERLSNYDNIIPKHTLPSVMAMLKKVPPEERKNYFFFFDFNDMYKIAEEIMGMGFKVGLFPTEMYYRMEKERETSKGFVKKFYPDVKVADSFLFAKVADGIKKLQESDGVFVLKSNGNQGKTIVPKSDDPAVAKEQVIDALEKCKSDYETGGFLLEQKILGALELTPIMVFWNGEPVYSICEYENKHYGAGNIGAQKGGNQVVSIRTELGARINQIAFPKIIYKMAKAQPGLSIFDAGLLYNGQDFYFTEFCAMRYGWDGILSEMVMRGDHRPFVGRYFTDIMNGKSPLREKYGVAVRLFNYEGDLEDTADPEGNEVMTWDPEIENNLFLYSAKKNEEGETVCTGDRDFVGAITGSGNTLEEAVERAYERVKQFNFEKLFYRPAFDFLSTDYASSIPNRIKATEEFLK